MYIRNQILIMKIGEAVSNETLLNIFQFPGVTSDTAVSVTEFYQAA